MQDPTLEEDNPMVSKELTISETLSKSITILTNNYILKGIDTDEDGVSEVDADFSDTNLIKEFTSREYTIKELLEEFPKFIKGIMPKLSKKEIEKAEILLYSCKGWNEDEIEVV